MEPPDQTIFLIIFTNYNSNAINELPLPPVSSVYNGHPTRGEGTKILVIEILVIIWVLEIWDLVLIIPVQINPQPFKNQALNKPIPYHPHLYPME